MEGRPQPRNGTEDCIYRMEEREPSYTVGGNINWRSHYGLRHGGASKKLKIELPYEPAIPSWVYIYISLLGIYSDKTIIRKDTCTPVFVTALFTAVK